MNDSTYTHTSIFLRKTNVLFNVFHIRFDNTISPRLLIQSGPDIPSFIPGLPRHHKLVLGTQSCMSLCDLQATERIRQVHASAIASQKAFSLSYSVLRGKQHQEDCRFRGNHFHHHATDSTVHEPTTRNTVNKYNMWYQRVGEFLPINLSLI